MIKITREEIKSNTALEITGMGAVVGIFMLGFMYVMLNLDKFSTIYNR